MIQVADDHWVHEDDLRRQVFGREDEDDIVDECVTYFHERGGDEASALVAHRAAGRLVAARVRRAASGLAAEQMRKKDAVIDRLLAFVPRREPEIPESRLVSFVGELVDAARQRFGEGTFVPFVTPETDPDSQAAHRLTLIAEPEAMDPMKWADATFSLHVWAAENLDEPERRALRLVVMPRD